MRWFVPGRLEVLGKHTDYAGGPSLLAAVDRGVVVDLTDGADAIVVESAALPGRLELRPGVDPGLPAGHWGHYVQSVLDRLHLNFGELRPARLSVESDLPLASGMSSSSALVVAVALALIDHNGLRERAQWRADIDGDIDLAGYLATMENGLSFGSLEGRRGVGTFGGSEDHTAMLCCREGQLTEFTFCPIEERRTVPMPAGWSFVVAVSGVLAEKTGAALASYNEASQLARELVEVWNSATGRSDATLAEALDSSEDALLGLEAISEDDDWLADRLTAFVTERRAIADAVVALQSGDVEAFGRAAELSHRTADQALGNQIPETNRLQSLARELGAPAASGFGAGFGGSVWALVPTVDADAFAASWLERYLAEYPGLAGAASTLVTRPGRPAHRR
ncbi:MAG TPA: galactokinase family protein [Propionicimonas sp.]|nr:galactokinase family protein [Propionicimonas sp.]